MKIRKTCLFSMLLLTATFGDAREGNDQETHVPRTAIDIKSDMVRELEAIRALINENYAPSLWKEEFCGWSLEEEYHKAKARIADHPALTVKEYQRIIRDFLASMQDYHVGIWFYSTESAFLPFTVKGVSGRYFISWIDRDRLNNTLEEGDELIAFDERPIDEVIQELREETRGGSKLTDQAIAERLLTSRCGFRGDKVPSGSVSVTIRRHRDGTDVSSQLAWDYMPEKITYPLDREIQEQKTLPFPGVSPWKLLENFVDRHKMIMPQMTVETGSEAIGGRESYLPDLGKLIWENGGDNPYRAYIFQTNDRYLIGYLRIPHYMVFNSISFSKTLDHLEHVTDMLVIDQLHNPGGSVFELYALASMLTNRALTTPRHKMTLTPELIYHSHLLLEAIEDIDSDAEAVEELGPDICGYPISLQLINFIRDYARFLIQEWEAGKKITAPKHLCVDHINPHPDVRYTKPILLLIDHLDFSGGDFFPAIMQDNRRATLLGTQTAGAGGYILGEKISSRFGIEWITYTGSIAERADGNPIENLGVSPDIEYRLTVEDLQTNYHPFVARIHKAIQEMMRQ